MKLSVAPLLCLYLLCFSSSAPGSDQFNLLAFTQHACKGWDDGSPLSTEEGELPAGTPILQRGRQVGTRFHFEGLGQNVALSVYETPGRPRQFMSIGFTDSGAPALMVSMGAACDVRLIRQANFSATDVSSHSRPYLLSISALDESLHPVGQPQWVNPPLEWVEQVSVIEPVPVRVGMIDSGVNYQLPEINTRLARTEEGALVGYDFWDMDSLPFDANVVGEGFNVQRHGTRTASIVLREAPGTQLVPYRYPRPDMERMAELVAHAVDNNVAILGMPLGSQSLDDWKAFQRAAEANPQLLFVVSAGNNGRNIENEPVYPAALDINNVLVVTSADDFVRPAQRTNWGRLSVDFMLPAERINALDFTGDEVSVSGSSYAVSRLVALAARLKQAHPDWLAKDLIRALRNRYTDGVGKRWVYSGYIADPLLMDFPSIKQPAVATVGFESLALAIQSHASAVTPQQEDSDYVELHLPLDVLVLDDRWTTSRIETVLDSAREPLRQCGVTVTNVNARRFVGPDYLRDLSTGTAKTIMDAASTTRATVVFARDTRMDVPFTGEAFGVGNTRDRPWLRHSVWMTEDIKDPGLALAHELVHVLSNSGDHVQDAGNLMAERTQPGQDRLNQRQCLQLRETGKNLALLLTP